MPGECKIEVFYRYGLNIIIKFPWNKCIVLKTISLIFSARAMSQVGGFGEGAGKVKLLII
jgi:hypothetical protein